MEQFKFCRICLVTDVNMYSLDITSNESIGVIYSQLAQIRLTDRNQHVCFECASLLQKYRMFKSKCLRAHNILSNILVTSKVLTKQIIQNIDRRKNNLESNLIISPIELYCETFDEFIHANSQTNCLALKNYYEDNNLEIELKSEVTESHEENDVVTGLPKTHNFNEDCYKDTAKEFQLLEEPNIKKEAIDEQDSKKTKNCDILSIETDTDNLLNMVNDPLDDSNNDNVFLSSDDNIPNEIVESVTDKCKTIKIQKTNPKKRKTKIDNDFSDNKLLSKRTKITKKVNKQLNKHSNLNLDFFADYGTVVSLTPDDAKKELLAKKDSENYILCPFKCDFCYKGYEGKATYDNHMKKHAVGNGDYECELCHLRFPSPVYLYNHRYRCHQKKFSCKLCPYICYSMTQAKTHVCLHKGQKYPCKICGEIFSMPNTLSSHKRLKHLNNSVAESVCDLCGDIFSSAMGVFIHQKKLHRMDKNNKQGPKCEECNVHFTSEVAWKRHLVLSTRHIVVNGCKYCGESFTSVTELKSHKQRQHKGMLRNRKHYALPKLPGGCPRCQKWLMNYEEYKSHMSIEHPQSRKSKILNKISSNIGKLVCEVCGRSFRLPCFLMYHQRIHTGERPYKCEDCGKTFLMAGALKEHQKSHTNISFECDVCNKVLATNSSLNKHKKIHEGIRPYKCKICEKGFINLCDLRVHIKYTHDKVPWPKKKNQKKNIADNNGLHAEHSK